MAVEILQSADPNFSFEIDLQDSLVNEVLYGDYDAGPVDSQPSDILQQSYDMFFGSSPLSSAPSSRCPSPDTQTQLNQDTQHKQLFSGVSGASPLSSAPHSPASSANLASADIRGPPPLSFDRQDADSSLGHGGSKKRRNKKKSKSSRRGKRGKEREEARHSPYVVDEGVLMRHTASAKPTATAFQVSDMPMARTSYTGLRAALGHIYHLEELLGTDLGFRLVKWDGRSSIPILADTKIIGVLAGMPKDPHWDDVHHNAFNILTASRDRLRFPPKTLEHRRGAYPALSCGISHGGGQVKPGNLRHHEHNAAILQELVSDPNIARIAGFSNGAFATWAPKLYTYYENQFESLLAHDSSLQRNYLNNVWAAMCFNFGPQTVTREHTDFANLPFGWCAITSLGQYDSTKGGHLILWKLKLVIEFPPGSTILIPSAAIPHGNVPIAEHEQRCSITQFSAGGLFRWVDYGFRSSLRYMAKTDSQEEARRMEERKKLGLSLFSTLEDLYADQLHRNTSF